MAIDPAVLAKQKRAAQGPRLHLVIQHVRPRKCDCGECKRCRNRAWMAAHRAANGAQGFNGPDPDRCCTLCRGAILKRNQSGVCTTCQGVVAHRDLAPYVARRGFISDGGGI